MSVPKSIPLIENIWKAQKVKSFSPYGLTGLAVGLPSITPSIESGNKGVRFVWSWGNGLPQLVLKFNSVDPNEPFFSMIVPIEMPRVFKVRFSFTCSYDSVGSSGKKPFQGWTFFVASEMAKPDFC